MRDSLPDTIFIKSYSTILHPFQNSLLKINFFEKGEIKTLIVVQWIYKKKIMDSQLTTHENSDRDITEIENIRTTKILTPKFVSKTIRSFQRRTLELTNETNIAINEPARNSEQDNLW